MTSLMGGCSCEVAHIKLSVVTTRYRHVKIINFIWWGPGLYEINWFKKEEAKRKDSDRMGISTKWNNKGKCICGNNSEVIKEKTTGGRTIITTIEKELVEFNLSGEDEEAIELIQILGKSILAMTRNDYRIRIALFLKKMGRATFAEIRNTLRIKYPNINNNTLKYHLDKMTEEGYIVQSMKRGNYSLTETGQDSIETIILFIKNIKSYIKSL